jgi:hypothetical protein
MKMLGLAVLFGCFSLSAACAPSADTLWAQDDTENKVILNGYIRTKLPEDDFVSSCCDALC